MRFGDELGYDIKLIASAERWPGQPYIALATRPCFVAKDQLLAQVHGSFNALAVGGHAVGPTLFTGHGAGQMPTASAVVGDLLNVASGAYPQGFAQMRITPDCNDAAPLVEADDLESRWYLRVDALNLPGVMAKLTAALGQRGISLSAILQHDASHAQDDTVPVVITTRQARLGDVQAAADEIAALPEIHGTPVIIRILELPG